MTLFDRSTADIEILVKKTVVTCSYRDLINKHFIQVHVTLHITVNTRDSIE